MRPRRIAITRRHVTITVTLTLYSWLALSSGPARQMLCGDAPPAVRDDSSLVVAVDGPVTQRLSQRDASQGQR